MPKAFSEKSAFYWRSAFHYFVHFLLFFRSHRATLIAVLIVIIGVMWTFGFIGLFRYEITILTGLIPSLVIVIEYHCIFLTNKYQQEYLIHGNKQKLCSELSQGRNRNFDDQPDNGSWFCNFYDYQ